MTVAGPAGPRTSAYEALIRGLLAVERRVAPLWAVEPASLRPCERQLRVRVTINCLRELDVLLGHWMADAKGCGTAPLQPEDPVASDWLSPAPPDAVGQPVTFEPADILAMLVACWREAHGSATIHGCNLLARSPPH